MSLGFLTPLSSSTTLNKTSTLSSPAGPCTEVTKALLKLVCTAVLAPVEVDPPAPPPLSLHLASSINAKYWPIPTFFSGAIPLMMQAISLANENVSWV